LSTESIFNFKKEKIMAKKNETKEITAASKPKREVVSSIREGMFVYVPSTEGMFGGIRDSSGSWGRSTPKSWMQAGPPWIQSGGQTWLHDEEMIEFGGQLSKELVIQLVQKNARIIDGSIETRRWRIAVPKAKTGEIRKLLVDNKIDFVQRVTTIPKG
jgi:hypothetical protein